MSQPGPKRFGLLLYEGFEVLDVFGPLEALNVISRPAFNSLYPYIAGISLAVIAEKPGPVTPATPNMMEGSSFAQQILAKYSLEDAKKLDLEVLLIPGGMGSDSTDTVPQKVIDWVTAITPSLKYLITVCTGSHIAAKAGVLDGLEATSNKAAWPSLEAPGATWARKTYWKAKARWVVSQDPRIWTTSGVSAGTDGFIAWIKQVYGEECGDMACKWMEYMADTDPDHDPFSEGLKDIPPTELKC